MDGFTVKLPGGRSIPSDMPLDPWTTRNVILQLHPANTGDITWLWRVTHSEDLGRGRYCVEVSMHRIVGRGEARDTDDAEHGVDCGICQDTEPGSLLVETTKCRHRFHFDCLVKWLQEQNVCPLCWQEDPLRP
ncbi:RING finger protein 148-like [Branchiostoma floridae]|uniref:RING finger protein 148-like n=1 Tax=Branchiostoma floridae TaxID=7739 RepID=A0A9J7LVS3_BRAFL|nr:RING finger protein 148-like [Branchiostoma floridae]